MIHTLLLAWSAAAYLMNASLQDQWADDLLDPYPFSGHERVLDLGCGPGKHTARIAQEVPDGFVLGLDNSPDMLAFAEETHDLEHFANLQFTLGDAANLPFLEEFDLVVALSSLQWVENQKAALDGIYGALKMGGQVLITLPAENPLTEAVELTLSSPQWAPYFENYERPLIFYTPAEYLRLLNAAGLHTTRCALKPFTAHFASRKRFEEWFSQWLPEKTQVPAHLRGKFIADIAANYAPEGRITLTHNALQVSAYK